MSKYHLILVLLILQAWVTKADDTERELFIEKGFNWKHYEKAQKLNLDLENYTIFNSNKSNRINGTIMMGIGGGCCGAGLYFYLWAVLFNSFEEDLEDDNYYYDYDYYYDDYRDYDDDKEAFNDFKVFCLISSGVCVATGVGLIIGGAAKRSKIGKVFTKSGTRLSLRPELDAINDRYGMRLSLSF